MYLHLVSRPEEAPLGRRLWHSKVDVVLDQQRASSQRYRVPSSHTAVGKYMMRAIGCPPDAYKMPNKPWNRDFSFTVLRTMATSVTSILLNLARPERKGLGSG